MEHSKTDVIWYFSFINASRRSSRFHDGADFFKALSFRFGDVEQRENSAESRVESEVVHDTSKSEKIFQRGKHIEDCEGEHPRGHHAERENVAFYLADIVWKIIKDIVLNPSYSHLRV